MIRQHTFNIRMTVEIGTELDFRSDIFDHQYMQLLSEDKKASAVVMRSQRHDFLSLTQVKFPSGLIVPHIMAVQVGPIMNGCFHELRNLITKEQADADKGI